MSPSPAAPTVTVGIVSWNGRHHLAQCLPALAAQEDPGVPWDIAVWDNGSSDGTEEWLGREHPGVRRLGERRNLGFCGAYNRLIAACPSEFVVLLNNDTRPRVDWLRQLVAAIRGASADVAAVSGLILDWEGSRLDFAEGLLTFDGHAFQRGYHRLLSDPAARIPAAGSELAFPCGGNAIVRRRSFLAAGSFDEAYFAYFEDVDLGWRLWSGGERVLFAPEAVVHHRSGATSDLLGIYNRGFLFERNALWTVYKNLDEETWPKLMPAILLTYLSRTQALLVGNNTGGERLTVDPYAGGIADTGADTGAGNLVDPAGSSPALAANAGRHAARPGWRRRLARRIEGSAGPARPGDRVDLADPRTISQFRATQAFLSRLEEAAAKRTAIQARRRRPDREFLTRFPLHLVPTYPGDVALFSNPGFRRWLPADPPLVDLPLEDILDAG